jgi:hypothetical protein
MKRVLLIAVLSLFGVSAWSQVDSIAPKVKGNYYGRGSVGLLVGEFASGSAQLSNGYSFGNGLDVGIGLGYENYNYQRFAPLFLETRYHFGKRETKLFVGLMSGYMAGLQRYNSNVKGFTAGFQFGVTHYFTKHFGITTSLGYRYSMLQSTILYYLEVHVPNPPVENENIHRIEARLGIVLR